mgnify:CR=1 FL=1|tara:strand:+ start:10786 stop:11091 length:306 start_codon:yes stop_codon:yes gene_type:complete
MDNIIRFPKEKTRISEIEYDLETVQIVAETLEDIMEDRGYDVNKIMCNDIKVLTNLAYASVRRQATQDDHHPFHEAMDEINDVIDSAMRMIKEEDELANDN